MKRLLITLVLVLMGFGVSACAISTSKENQPGGNNLNPESTESPKALNYENITPEEAKQRLGSEKNVILLDVRTLEENLQKRIPGSVLIPVDEIKEEAPSKLTDKDATILVYCRSGRRSITASEALIELGYTSVYNLGGIIDWPYETERGE